MTKQMADLTQEEIDNLSPEQRASFESLADYIGNPKAELDPELVPYLQEVGSLGLCLKHPLVFNMMHTPTMNHAMNRALAAKKEMLADYEADKNWSGYCYAYERPYRLDAFMGIEGEITDDCQYWDILGDLWTDSENIFENEEYWHDCLHADRERRECFMDETERAALDGLDDTITVHRGYKLGHRQMGYSWTTNYPQAAWFAKRLAHDDDTPRVVSGTVQKKDVIGYKLGRGESEIVVVPENVQVTEDAEANWDGRNPAERESDAQD